jgi:hypothetical protein
MFWSALTYSSVIPVLHDITNHQRKINPKYSPRTQTAPVPQTIQDTTKFKRRQLIISRNDKSATTHLSVQPQDRASKTSTGPNESHTAPDNKTFLLAVPIAALPISPKAIAEMSLPSSRRQSSEHGRIGMLSPLAGSTGNDMAIPNEPIQRVRRDHRILRGRPDRDGVRFAEVGHPIDWHRA